MQQTAYTWIGIQILGWIRICVKRIRILSFGKIIKILNLKYNSCLYSKINVFPWRQDVPGPKDTTIQGISPSPRHRPGGQRRGGGG